uniref:Uncharacterized protein n=1 Tax=Arundo donax TaxID=35708 RepID=A0A0A9G0S8_ARUDO
MLVIVRFSFMLTRIPLRLMIQQIVVPSLAIAFFLVLLL